MLTRNVGGYRILNTNGALARLSNRPGLTPEAREAVAQTLVKTMESKLPGRMLPRFERGVLISALSQASGYNGGVFATGVSLQDIAEPIKFTRGQKYHIRFNSALKDIVKTADTAELARLSFSPCNGVLDEVVSAPNVSDGTLIEIALKRNEPAIKAYEKLEKRGLLDGGVLALLSGSENLAVTAEVSKNDLTPPETLVKVILEINHGYRMLSRPVIEAFKTLNRTGALTGERREILMKSQNPYVRMVVDAYSSKEEQPLVDAALDTGDFALTAYERLHAFGMQSAHTLGALAESANTDVLARVANNPTTPPEALAKLALRKDIIAVDAINRLSEANAFSETMLSDLSQSKSESVLMKVAQNDLTPINTVAEIISKLFNGYLQEYMGANRKDADDSMKAKLAKELKSIIMRCQAARSDDILRELGVIDPVLAKRMEINWWVI